MEFEAFPWLVLTHSNGVIYGLKQANLVSYVSPQPFNVNILNFGGNISKCYVKNANKYQ